MDKMRREILRLNISNYERLLNTETDAVKLHTLRNLLTEARSEAMALGQESAPPAEKHMGDFREDARRLRLRAEEYRTIADASKNDGMNPTYRCLAKSYDLLAERVEKLTARAGNATRTGQVARSRE